MLFRKNFFCSSSNKGDGWGKNSLLDIITWPSDSQIYLEDCLVRDIHLVKQRSQFDDLDFSSYAHIPIFSIYFLKFNVYSRFPLSSFSDDGHFRSKRLLPEYQRRQISNHLAFTNICWLHSDLDSEGNHQQTFFYAPDVNFSSPSTCVVASAHTSGMTPLT